MATIRRPIMIVLIVLIVVAGGMIATQQANAASSTPVVYVATGENFPDALGAASAAAVQGGPVLLVNRDSIPQATKDELTRLVPDRIVVAGGTAVVSSAVFSELGNYAPTVERAAGPDRYATAAEVSRSAFPVIGGGSGDLASLIATVAALSDRVDTLEAENAKLQALLAGVTRNGSTLMLDGMNLQIVNGTGTTAGPGNSVGNIIIGYNEAPNSPTRGYRAGSHNLVVGSRHTYTEDSYGGIVVGAHNTISAPYASVSGGISNTADGETASVSGGAGGTASGDYASVSGGLNNTASGPYASVSGGSTNTASGSASSILGGYLQAMAAVYGHYPS